MDPPEDNEQDDNVQKFQKPEKVTGRVWDLCYGCGEYVFTKPREDRQQENAQKEDKQE